MAVVDEIHEIHVAGLSGLKKLNIVVMIKVHMFPQWESLENWL